MVKEQATSEKIKVEDKSEGCISLFFGAANLGLVAYILTCFWEWFIAPLSPHLVANLSFGHALGIIILLILLDLTKFSYNHTYHCIILLICNLLVWGAGWLVHIFIVHGFPIRLVF